MSDWYHYWMTTSSRRNTRGDLSRKHTARYDITGMHHGTNEAPDYLII